MNDIVNIVILAGVGVFLLFLFYMFAYKPYASRKEYKNPRFRKDQQGTIREKGVGMRKCPVCNEVLAPGMQVKSKLFSQKGRDRIMHVLGCPYCWPENTEFSRMCPVCAHIIPRNGYLIARYFEDAKHKHVHVLGCSGCRKG